MVPTMTHRETLALFLVPHPPQTESLSVSPNGLLNDLSTLSGVFGEGSVVGFLGGVSGLG